MSPEVFNFMNDKILKFEGDSSIPWSKKTGREVFNLDSLTGLNKTPVKVLESFILGGVTLSSNEPPFKPRELTKNLLIDGTIVIQTIETSVGQEHVFLSSVLFASATKFIQELPGVTTDGQVIHRIWTLESSRWLWRDVTNIGEKDETAIDSTDVGVDAKNIFVFPNENGILYDAQFTYRRLEEIERKVRKASNSAVSMILTGYTGMMTQLYKALRDNGTDDKGVLVVPTGTTIDFPKTTAVVDQLHADFKLLLPGYFKQTNLVDLDDSGVISGKAVRLIMRQTLEFVSLTRRQIEEIYANWGIKVAFDTIPLLSADEKLRELDVLDRLLASNVIPKTEYKRRALKLI